MIALLVLRVPRRPSHFVEQRHVGAWWSWGGVAVVMDGGCSGGHDGCDGGYQSCLISASKLETPQVAVVRASLPAGL